MNPTMAKAFIACGALAAGLGGAITAIVVVNSVVGGQLIAYAIPAIFMALAYGIYRKSRLCALIAFLTFAVMRIRFYGIAVMMQNTRGGAVMRGFWISVAVFGLLYLLGVIGTIAWHLRHPERALPIAPPVT
ncbi:MAG: hypothetical protein IVW56_12925 [Candidatus Binataceae bacterium]|nr:hypothetical protein [Candidatus Binataceae bacterium]